MIITASGMQKGRDEVVRFSLFLFFSLPLTAANWSGAPAILGLQMMMPVIALLDPMGNK